jgi:hypothetical protein
MRFVRTKLVGKKFFRLTLDRMKCDVLRLSILG